MLYKEYAIKKNNYKIITHDVFLLVDGVDWKFPSIEITTRITTIWQRQ